MKPRSLMFTLYGEYIKYYGGEVWVGSLIQLMSKFGVSESSVRGAVYRMVQKKYLENRKLKNKSYYSVTEKGKRNVEDGVRRVYSSHKYNWDKSWRILTYTFPEEERELRNQIRKELNWMGFGLISNSTWISPNSIETQVMDLINTYELEENITFFSSSKLVSHSVEHIINKGWDLKYVSDQYEIFINEYSAILEELKEKAFSNTLTDEQCFTERTSLVHEYRKFLFKDPGFPVELLPSYWAGTKAHELFREMHQFLALPAVRFFESVFEGPPNSNISPNRYKATNPFSD